MPRLSQHHFTYSFRLRHLVVLMAMIAILAQPSLAQTYTILHTFTGGMDGGDPYSGLSIDQAGNLYGTAAYGGRGFGVVYELARKNAGWIFHPLYNFAGGTNGEGPLARVTFGANGTLYGTTYAGGNVACGEGLGCGTVFNVRPSPTFCRAASCPWMQTVLYRFNGDNDGANPLFGDLTFDASGNMYGTTSNGGGTGCGGAGCGIVYELSHNAGGWSESVLHMFTGENGDGANPNAGVAFDASRQSLRHDEERRHCRFEWHSFPPGAKWVEVDRDGAVCVRRRKRRILALERPHLRSTGKPLWRHDVGWPEWRRNNFLAEYLGRRNDDLQLCRPSLRRTLRQPYDGCCRKSLRRHLRRRRIR